jgi:RNA polymerase sigma-70 factor, ECF subfamily
MTGARALSSPEQSSEFETRNQAWAALIGRVAGGESDALTALYDATNRLIFGLLLRILGNSATAEEVLFEVYAQVWRQAARYDARRGNPVSWLVTMARSRAIDRLRADGQATRHEQPLDEMPSAALTQDVERLAANAETRELVCAALDALPAEQREVIELAFYSGMTHSEMAAHLKQPLGTIKTRARRGMIKLREVLAAVVEGGR